MHNGTTIDEIERLVDALISAAPLPTCIGCEAEAGSPNYLVPCRNCHSWVCTECRKDHCCGAGENVAPFRY